MSVPERNVRLENGLFKPFRQVQERVGDGLATFVEKMYNIFRRVVINFTIINMQKLRIIIL